MMVIGVDPHKQSHTAVAADELGRERARKSVRARREGYRELIAWARQAGPGERRWAVEDVRHVAGGLVRELLGAGEQVVFIPPRLTAGARRGGRERGKSDPIDALAVARARQPHLLPAGPLGRMPLTTAPDTGRQRNSQPLRSKFVRTQGLQRIVPDSCQHGAEPAGVAWRQMVRDDLQYPADFVKIWAAIPFPARVGPVPSAVVGITQVKLPVTQGLLCPSRPQTGVLKVGQHGATTGRQAREL
jgi:hypothetical protein